MKTNVNYSQQTFRFCLLLAVTWMASSAPVSAAPTEFVTGKGSTLALAVADAESNCWDLALKKLSRFNGRKISEVDLFNSIKKDNLFHVDAKCDYSVEPYSYDGSE